jgi:hypothetical protein
MLIEAWEGQMGWENTKQLFIPSHFTLDLETAELSEGQQNTECCQWLLHILDSFLGVLHPGFTLEFLGIV